MIKKSNGLKKNRIKRENDQVDEPQPGPSRPTKRPAEEPIQNIHEDPAKIPNSFNQSFDKWLQYCVKSTYLNSPHPKSSN